MEFTRLDEPMNATERYLNGVCERLEALLAIHTPKVTETQTVAQEAPKTRTRKAKTT